MIKLHVLISCTNVYAKYCFIIVSFGFSRGSSREHTFKTETMVQITVFTFDHAKSKSRSVWLETEVGRCSRTSKLAARRQCETLNTIGTWQEQWRSDKKRTFAHLLKTSVLLPPGTRTHICYNSCLWPFKCEYSRTYFYTTGYMCCTRVCLQVSHTRTRHINTHMYIWLHEWAPTRTHSGYTYLDTRERKSTIATMHPRHTCTHVGTPEHTSVQPRVQVAITRTRQV